MADLPIAAAPIDFRIGSIVRRSFAVFAAAVGRFLTLGLIANAPLLLFRVWFVTTGVKNSSGTAIPVATVVILLLQAGSAFVVQAAMAYGAFQQMRGHAFTLRGALRQCLARAAPLLALASFALLVFIASAALSAVLAIFAGLSTPILISLVMLAVVAVGMLAAVAFYASPPICVVERLGPLASLRRSADLTNGYRWRILAVFLVFTIITFAAAYLAMLIVTMLAPVLAAYVADYVLTAVASAIGSVLIAVVYHDLRVIKEGISLDNIAAVFD